MNSGAILCRKLKSLPIRALVAGGKRRDLQAQCPACRFGPETVTKVTDHHVSFVRSWAGSFAKGTEAAFNTSLGPLRGDPTDRGGHLVGLDLTDPSAQGWASL